MTKYQEYELNLLNVEQFQLKTNSRLRFWYDHIRNNACNDDGDIYEFGVYQGASLIAAALLLRELGSSKKVYGFDSFEGFPSYSKYDDLSNFYNSKIFSKSFIASYEKFIKLKSKITRIEKFNPITISRSGDFRSVYSEFSGKDDTKTLTSNYDIVMSKIDHFELDNIILIKGSFEKTVINFFKDKAIKVSSCNMDCDLYDGYATVLPHVYKSLSNGGYINLDEYFSFKYPGARIATDEFCKSQNIEPIKQINREGEFERWYMTK